MKANIYGWIFIGIIVINLLAFVLTNSMFILVKSGFMSVMLLQVVQMAVKES